MENSRSGVGRDMRRWGAVPAPAFGGHVQKGFGIALLLPTGSSCNDGEDLMDGDGVGRVSTLKSERLVGTIGSSVRHGELRSSEQPLACSPGQGLSGARRDQLATRKQR